MDPSSEFAMTSGALDTLNLYAHVATLGMVTNVSVYGSSRTFLRCFRPPRRVVITGKIQFNYKQV